MLAGSYVYVCKCVSRNRRIVFLFFFFFITFSLTFCLSIRRSSISSRLVGIEMLVLRIRVEYSVVDLSAALPSVFLYSLIFVILSAGVRVTNISSLRSTTFEASGKFILSFVHVSFSRDNCHDNDYLLNNYFIEFRIMIIHPFAIINFKLSIRDN